MYENLFLFFDIVLKIFYQEMRLALLACYELVTQRTVCLPPH